MPEDLPYRAKLSRFLFYSILLVFGALRLDAAPAAPPPKPAPADPVKAGPVTLVDCINIAIQNNPKVLLAQQDLEAAKGVQVQARAVWYPQVGTRAYIEERDNDTWGDKKPPRYTTDGFYEDWKIELTVTQSVLSGGKNSADIDNARLTNEIEFIDFQIATNSAVAEAKKAFYQLLVTRKLYEIEQQNVGLLRQELERQKILFDAGRSSRFNIVRTEVRLSNEIPAQLSAQNDIELAKLNLLNVLGLRWGAQVPDLPQRVEGEMDCPPIDFSLDQLLELAHKQRPEPTQWNYVMQREKNNATIARAMNIPQIDAYVGGDVKRDPLTGSSFTDSKTEASFGLLGVWNIFDGFKAKGLVMQAEAKQKKAAIAMDNSWRQIELEVRRGYLKLKEAEATLNSQRENVKRAYESLDLSRLAVDAGRGTQYDTIQSTTDLNDAQKLENRARFDYHIALIDLESATFSFMKGLQAEEQPLRMSAQPPPAAPAAPVGLRGMQNQSLRGP